MPRSIVVLIAVVLVLVAGLFFFASRDTHKEPTRVEKAIPLENLAN
jgi:hypothetical protein